MPLHDARKQRRNPGFRTMNLSTQMNDEPLEIPAGLFADRPGKNSRFSGSTASSNTSTDPHAKTFGLSLAAVLAACLVLNAASPSTRICQKSDRDFGITSTDSASASKRIVPALGRRFARRRVQNDPFQGVRNERGSARSPATDESRCRERCRCATGSSKGRIGSTIRQQSH